MLPWIREPRVAGGQETAYGRSLQRHLSQFDLPTWFAVSKVGLSKVGQ